MNAVTSASLDIRLQDLLRQMRLPTVSANYRKLASEAADSGQPYEEYLLALLEQEAAQRDINRRKRRIREARFPILHTLDEYDFSLMPRLSKPKILELARGNFLDKAENAVFVGAIGTGKTHLATAVGLAACEQGRRVRFYTTAGLINDLLEAAEVHQLSRLERQLMKHDLVILDELGFVPFSQ
jgi:DNA replication protein DnaC